MFRSAVAVSSRVAASGTRALSNSAVSMAAPTKAEISEVFKDKSAPRRSAYSINRVELLGGVADQPKRLVAKNGKDYVIFNVITNSTSRTASGEIYEIADRHTITAFGKLAEHVEARVSKGTRVLVHGRLHTSGGALKEDGTRTPRVTSINAEAVQPLAKRENNNNTFDR